VDPHHVKYARAERLVVEEVGEELLVYDERNDTAHCLASTAAAVFRLCDGELSVRELTATLAASDDRVDIGSLGEIALAELAEKGLVEPVPTGRPMAQLSRREAMRRLAGAGAAAASVPLVLSATVAAPSAHATTCVQRFGTCTANSQCCPNQSLTCTDGGTNTGTRYCNSADCTKGGIKPKASGSNARVDCTAATREDCCSGQCDGNVCRA
jgi:hypothetical protein